MAFYCRNRFSWSKGLKLRCGDFTNSLLITVAVRQPLLFTSHSNYKTKRFLRESQMLRWESFKIYKKLTIPRTDVCVMNGFRNLEYTTWVRYDLAMVRRFPSLWYAIYNRRHDGFSLQTNWLKFGNKPTGFFLYSYLIIKKSHAYDANNISDQ